MASSAMKSKTKQNEVILPRGGVRGRDTIFGYSQKYLISSTLVTLSKSFVHCFGFPKSKYDKEFLTPHKKVFAK